MASGGVDNETLDKDICNCTICLETFKVPKILPCSHTFCQPCLNTYILSTKGEKLSTKGEKSQPVYFLCPVCRTEVTVPDPKAPAEEWAKLMPLNNMIASLTEGSSTGQTRQADNEKKCDPCERHGESNRGQFWCFECQEHLCEFCQKCHQRIKAVAGHKIVPVHELKTEDLGIKSTDVEEPCFEHKGEFLKVYCVDHLKMCCVLCLSINHRKCENIKTFDQMAESLKESDETQKLAETMKTFGQKMEELIGKKQENIEVLGQQKQDILEDVAKMIRQAKEKLDKCHEDFKTHISQTHKKQTTKLVETKERFEIFQNSISNCEKMLQTVLRHGSPKHIFIASEKIKERFEIQAGELQGMLESDEHIAYDIMVDKHVAEITNSMKSAAVLKLNKSEESIKSIFGHFLRNRFKDDLLQSRLKAAHIDDLEAVKLWDIEGDGWYTDAVFLKNDDALLVVDTKKYVLLVYDNKGKLLFSCPLGYKPWAVAQSSDGKIFVSDLTSPGIRIYKMEHQSIQQVRFLATKEKNVAVNIMLDNIVVTQKTSVILFTENEQQRNVIGKCHERSFVAVSESDASCFCCRDENCVVKYSFDSKEIMRHKCQNIQIARGIALDKAENIYVCGNYSHNVLIVSKDGMSSRILLSKEDDISYPYSIGFDHTGTRFFLTGSTRGTVTMFSLNVKSRH